MELQCNSIGLLSISNPRLQLFIAKSVIGISSSSLFFNASGALKLNRKKHSSFILSSSIPSLPSLNAMDDGFFGNFRLNASENDNLLETEDRKEEGGDEERKSSSQNDTFDMEDEERREWRRKIREVISANPDVEEEIDSVEKKRKMEKLLAKYPLVVEEEDPDWPEDAEGWGFNLSQFFDKISIKNVKKDDEDDNYDSDKEIVWQDDDYIRPIKDIKSAEWENTVFKDISPLIVLVHNRYRRPKENEKIRDALEKAVQIIWNCQLPAPRCVAIDAVLEVDLVSALHVSTFPQLIFTNAGKILYREKEIRTPDELSRIMAFFYFKAAKPPCLAEFESIEELVPSFSPE